MPSVQREQLQAANEFLEKEIQRLQAAARTDSADQAMLAEFQRMDDQTRRSMAEFLDQNAAPAPQASTARRTL